MKRSRANSTILNHEHASSPLWPWTSIGFLARWIRFAIQKIYQTNDLAQVPATVSLQAAAAQVPELELARYRQAYLAIAAALLALVSWLVFLSIMSSVYRHAGPFQIEIAIMTWMGSIRSPVLNSVMAYFTCLAHWQVYSAVVLPLVGLMIVRRQWWWLAALGATLAGRQLLVDVFKQLVGRDRPDLTDAVLSAAGSSFPSGHALAGLTIYGLLASYLLIHMPDRKLQTLITAFAILLIVSIAASRVYLGVHWPLDVIAGLVLGIAMLASGLTVFCLATSNIRPSITAATPLPPAFAALALVAWLLASGVYAATRPAFNMPDAGQSAIPSSTNVGAHRNS